MALFFGIVFSIVIMQRLSELRLAKHNRDYILSQGGYEAGASHYKYIVHLHLLFFASLLAEVRTGPLLLPAWWWLPFSLFLLAQVGRYWCIRSLGRHWNTRILILPGSMPVKRGPYRYLRHPNYLIVTLELCTLPLCFGAYFTACFFPVANLLLLRLIRIPVEEEALRSLLPENDAQLTLSGEDAPDLNRPTRD